MTKEEIISGLKFTIEMFLFDPNTGEKYTEPRNDMDKTTIDACKGAIELIKQEPKTGHWILDDTDNSITCDKCGCLIWANDISNGDAHYCPNCGARMVEQKESEDKE